MRVRGLPFYIFFAQSDVSTLYPQVIPTSRWEFLLSSGMEWYILTYKWEEVGKRNKRFSFSNFDSLRGLPQNRYAHRRIQAHDR